jgi:hypothetical protein
MHPDILRESNIVFKAQNVQAETSGSDYLLTKHRISEECNPQGLIFLTYVTMGNVCTSLLVTKPFYCTINKE